VNCGWRNMPDWIGAGRRLGPYLPFEKARAVARTLGIASAADWHACAAGKPGSPELPDGIPGSPQKTHASLWSSWNDGRSTIFSARDAHSDVSGKC
jgi:hypothetical protein